MRKVSVGLEADVAGFVRPVETAKKSVDDLGDKVDGLDRSLKKIPADAAKAGAAMRLLGGDANGISKQFDEFGVGGTNALKLIDKKIEDTRANVKRFASDFNRNGSLTSFDLWQSASKDLAGLERIKKQLAKALDDGAKEGGKLGAPSFMASLGIALAGVAPFLGSVLGAAIIGGGGLSMIGLGIVGQIKNPAVREAFAEMAALAKEDLQRASGAFGPALVRGAQMLGAELNKISPKLQEIFDRLAPVFEKLFGGGVSFFDRLLPGLDALSRAAGPVLGMLANELPGLGDALTSMFTSISAGAPGAANGLHALFTIIDTLIVGTGKLIHGFEELPGPIQATLAIVGVLGAAFLLLAPKIMAAKAAITELGNGSLAADTKMGTLARSAGKVALALAAVQVASAAIGHGGASGVDTTTRALDNLRQTGFSSSDALKHLNYDLGTLGTDGWTKFNNAWSGGLESITGLGGVFDESLQHAQERIGAIDGALAQMVQSGHADEAAASFDQIAHFAQQQGISIEDLKKALPQYQNALDAAAAANERAGATAAAAALDFDALAAKLNKTEVTADSLEAAMVNKVFTATMNLDQATLGLAEAQTRLEQTFKKNGLAIDKHTGLVAMNTEKGQANREAVLAMVTANMQAYQSQIAVGMSADDASKAYDEGTKAIEAQLRAAGLNSQQIDDLIGKYRNIPHKVDTDIAINGLTKAIDNLTDLIKLINGIHDKTVTVYYRTKGQSLNAPLAHGGIRHAATGMIVAPSDPGTLIAEPQTGGEALIPLRGISQSRAMSLAQVVGDSYGFTVAAAQNGYADMRSAGQMGWSGGGGGGMQTLRVVVQYPDGRVIRDQVVDWNANRGRTDPATFFLP